MKNETCCGHPKNSERPILGSAARFSRSAALLAAALLVFASSAEAVFTTKTYYPSGSAGGDNDLNDLDHHNVYSWKINNLTTETITSAKISITQIANWDPNIPNKLFFWLLDTAKNNGVAEFQDDPANVVTNISDFFTYYTYNGQRYSKGNALIDALTKQTALTAVSFDTVPNALWEYTFTAAQLSALNSYKAVGNDIALGFDPDCHYFNDGISFTICYGGSPGPSPIPEVSAFAPLGGVLGLAIGVQTWLRRRRTANLAA